MTLSDSDMDSKKYSDMGHCHFLNSAGDKGNIKRQRHVTLGFLKTDMQHQDPPPPPPRQNR